MGREGCSYRLNAIRREIAQTGLVKVGWGGGGGSRRGSGTASFARLSAT